MRITGGQLRSFEEMAITTLARQWRPLLREHFGARLASLDDQALLAHTIEGIKRGKTYDLELDSDLYRFVIARIALGDEFDVDPGLPWAAQLLRGRSRPAGARMKELIARAIELLQGRPQAMSAGVEAQKEALRP